MRRRLGTVRFRTTVAATAVVAVALAAAAVVLVVALRSSLERNLRSSAELRAADVAALVADDRLPRELPEPRGEEEGALVQVVDAGGTVMASTPEAEEGGSLAVFDLDEGERVGSRTVAGPRFDEDDDFVVVAMRAPGPGGEPHTVYVGASLEEVDATVAAARNVLLAGVPVVTLVLATTTWVVVGRALHPVEALRSEVAEITGSDLHRRVPTPEGDDEVARLARTMNGMLDRLDVASERQRRFVADAAHELQSPLAAARTSLEVGIAGGTQTDWPATAAEVLDEHDRTTRLLRDLLFLARADEGLGDARRTEVDLDDVVFAEVDRLRPRATAVLDTSGVSAGRVRGDADALGRAVRNLLENADRHAAGVVRVDLTRAGEDVQLVVADDGPGIPLVDRARVFDRFARLDPGRSREEGGTGLGLAITKQIVEAHGGSIGVLEGDGGARVAVRLPAAHAVGA
ncbi:MAG TPA: ATP-binding protein [Acidimicrobiales bacterium]|nr:ATP-binding protein [Acidimicrobiales bacterium]